MLVNHFLRSIQSRMDDIRVVTVYYVFLKLLCNPYSVLVRNLINRIMPLQKDTFYILRLVIWVLCQDIPVDNGQ